MEFIYGIFGSLIKKLCGAGVAAFNNQALIASYGNVASVTADYRGLAEGLIPLGVLILALYWSGSLLNEVLHKDFDIEIIIRSLLRLAIGAIIVSNCVAIMDQVISLVDSIFAEVSGNTYLLGVDAITDELAKFKDTIDSKAVSGKTMYGLFQSLFIALTSTLTSLVIPISLTLHGLTRKIELTQLYVYAPIGISDMYEGGMNSGGMRYIRKFFASAMEVVIVYVALMAYSLIVSAIDVNWTAFGVWVQVAAMCGTVSWIRRSRKFSKQIFC